MKLETIKKLAIASIAIYAALTILAIIFGLFVFSETLRLASVTPEELEASPFPYLRFLIVGTVIFALLISLVAIAYYVVYSFVLVGSTKFENKTIMILLIIGILLG